MRLVAALAVSKQLDPVDCLCPNQYISDMPALSNSASRAVLDYIRRVAVGVTIVLWLGGFTVYSIVVVHTAHRILHSHVRVGMVTQVVTHWLNAFGVAMIAALLWNLLVEGRSWPRWPRRIALGTWTIMALAQLALICLHPMMDAQIDSAGNQLRDERRFHQMHQLYLTLSTAEWVACILHGSVLLWPRKPAGQL